MLTVGFKSTEFWSLVVLVLVTLAKDHLGITLNAEELWALFGGVGLYSVGRGLSKVNKPAPVPSVTKTKGK